VSDEGLSEFERRLALKEKQAASAEQPAINWDEFVPEVDSTLSPEDEALDAAIRGMSIVDAYRRWCKKMVPDTRSGRQREGIKVSCPNPAHPDKHPSAWLNTQKNLYYCSGCAEGGDVWDIAAWHFGYGVPGYKSDATAFRELREKMGTDLGFAVVKGLTGTFLIAPGTSEEPVLPIATPEPVPVGVLPSAVAADQDEEEHSNKVSRVASIDWKTIVPEGTFLRSWLEATTVDDCPEEYHFWTGLMAIGFAVGRNRVLMDARPVIPNLFVCFVGPSGAGKSSAKAHLVRIVQDVMPYSYDDPLSTGVKHVSSPGSAEFVVKTFSAPVFDPAAPKRILMYAPVRAQIDFEELSSLVSISGRAGSVMKPVLLEVYDGAAAMGSGSLTHGDRSARDPFGQVTSTTQDGSLKALLDRSDEVSGFMNRWIFASGRLKQQRSLGGAMVDTKVAADKLKAIWQWSATTKSLIMDDDAFAAWDSFFHEVLVPVKSASEKAGSALLNRLDLLFKKLIVLFSCNMMEDQVSLAAVQQAISLYPYMLATYGVVQYEMSVTPETDLNNRVLDAIMKFQVANLKGPTMRELYPTVKKHGSQKVILETIKNMALLGLIEEVPSPAGQRGRPTVRYTVNG
jgi:hypothetical protein